MDPATPNPQQPLQPTPAPSVPNRAENPEQWKMIVTIICLIFVPLLGIIFMWLWMKNWPTWVKVVITLIPIIIFVLTFGLITTIFLSIPKNSWKSSNPPNFTISSPAPANSSLPTDNNP